MPAKKNKVDPETLTGPKLIKEVCRRIRLAKSRWKDHNNKACRAEREKALALYEKTGEQTYQEQALIFAENNKAVSMLAKMQDMAHSHEQG